VRSAAPDFFTVKMTLTLLSHHLDLHCKDGSLMAFVSTALPNHIRSMLEVNLLSALERPELLEEVDTQSPGCQHFQAMHLSWYNRHSTSVRARSATARFVCLCAFHFETDGR
jgi:hypothetical protein